MEKRTKKDKMINKQVLCLDLGGVLHETEKLFIPLIRETCEELNLDLPSDKKNKVLSSLRVECIDQGALEN